MGRYPPNGPVTGGVPGTGGMTIYGETPAAAGRREVVIHLGSGKKGGGRVQGDGRVHLAKKEHGRAVHCYVIAYGPM